MLVSSVSKAVGVVPHNLKGTLANLHVTQAHVATYLGRSPCYVHRILNGFSPMPADEERRLRGLVEKLKGTIEEVASHG